MKLSLQKLTLAVLVLIAGVQPALGQQYPLPGKSSAAPVMCTTATCVGNNASGQANNGLKTWPYSPPLVNHVSRLVDSVEVTDFQGGTGFATARARIVRFARERHGNVPPRMYVQIGSAIGIYSLDRLTSPKPLTVIDAVLGQTIGRSNSPHEKVQEWDAWIFPENPSSGWAITTVDGQDKLYDFDIDDRGFVYVATGNHFGWGLVTDTGSNAGSLLQLAAVDSQITGSRLNGVSPDHIVSIKTGGRYYAVTSSGEGGRVAYDTTTTAGIQPGSTKTGVPNAFIAFARDDTRERIGIVTLTRRLEIYDYASFVAGGAPLIGFDPPSGKSYRDITVDESGNFWSAETTNTPEGNKLVKLERGTSTYTRRTFDVFGEPFTPSPGPSEGLSTINYGDKYLTVMGRRNAGGGLDNDVKIFKIESGSPILQDFGDFFSKYYWKAPRDYAQPRGNVTRTMGAYPIKWNNKMYMVFNVQGLGDIYELAAGDSINVTQKSGNFGTANPYSKSTAAGPYYGDMLKFGATSSSATQYALTWDFDNSPEGGSENQKPGNTGSDVTYQYTGLNTSAKIEQTRHVTATANGSPEVNGTVNVTNKVPTARIGIVGTNVALTTDNGVLDIVAGDQITDAGDGNVESHYAAWTVDSTTTNLAPNTPLAAPSVGTHTLTLASKYGKYDGSFNTTGSPYTDTVSTVALTVRPFVISFTDPSVSGPAVTFKGSARVTQLSSILSASTWSVEWTLKSGGIDVVPPQTGNANVGTIPDFTVGDRSSIPSGSILQLKVSVSSGLGTGVPAEYGTHTISQTLLTPDPKITRSGCDNVGAACAFTVSSIHPYPTTDWSVTWTLKLGGTTVGTSTLAASQQYKPSITNPGSYTVTAKAATSLFEGTATLGPWTAGGVVCGDPPNADQIAIYTSCDTCDVNQNVTMRADSLNYSFQDCETYNWIFGDGGTTSTQAVNVTHKYTSAGTYTIKLTITKGTQTSPQYTQQIKIGSTGGGGNCTIPSGINVDFTGNKGCQPGVPCKTNESVSFIAYRGIGPLQTCDTTSWSFGDGGTSGSRTPSHTFTSAGTYTVDVIVSNNAGQTTGTIPVTVVVDQGGGGGDCNQPANADQAYVDFSGATSGCNSGNGKTCKKDETISFRAIAFLGSKIQACDQFDWDFGDGTSHSSAAEPTHKYTGNAASYRVRLRLYNATNGTGNTIIVDVPLQGAPILELPVLNYSAFPTTGTKGNSVSFTVNSNISATGWQWTFGDGQTDNSQAGAVGTSNTITHTFATAGNFTVTVKARNSQDTSSAQTSQVSNSITISDTPEYRYLLPAVAHAAGIGSTWRTDVQIYTSDSAVSPSNPLTLTASFKGVEYPLQLTKSTKIIEDILNELRPGETEQGAMIISVRTQHPPQIWSRTYNQTAAGTFGQFVPAILLNEAGGGSAIGEGKYYLAGVRSDSRYRTNVGLVNPNNQPITAILRIYDDTGLPFGSPISRPLQPFALDQFGVTGPSNRPFSVEIEIPAGTWLIGYASFIDGGSSDPIFLQAVRQSELGSSDYREQAIPGVGHTGAWRSDVTIYNPNGRIVTVDLAYHNAAGAKIAEAKSVPINAGQFLQYGDILKQGVLGNVGDAVGMLRISMPTAVSADYFPMTFARTYNDNGTGKTYGQGIAGFALNRANVKVGKSALIPAVRSDDKYYTNLGLTNVSSTTATAIVRVLDPNTGNEIRRIDYTLQPNESIVATQFDIVGRANASLRIEATGGNIWAFASIIDKGTFDPEYVAATPLP